MQVIAGRAACAADLGNLLTAPHYLPDFGQQTGSMRITRNNIIAVVYLRHITILRMAARIHHDATGRSPDGRAFRHHIIHALVHRVLAGEGVYAPTEVGGIPANTDRRHGR